MRNVINNIKYFASLIHVVFLTTLAYGQETPIFSLELFQEFQYQSLDVSCDGNRLITGGDRAIIWNANIGKETIRMNKPGTIASVSFSKDGNKFLAGGDDYIAYVCDTKTASIIHTVKAATATKYTGVGYINKVLFSPDDKLFATFDYRQGWLKIWDTETGELHSNLGDGNLYPVKFHPNGKEIICQFEKKLIFVDTYSGETVRIIKDINYSVSLRDDEKISYIQNIDLKDRLIVQNLLNDTIEMNVEWPESIGPRTFDVSDDLGKIALAKQEIDSNRFINRSLLTLTGMKSIYDYQSEFEAEKKETNRVDKIIEFFPDGKKLVTVNGKYVNIWDIENITTGVRDVELLNR